MTKRKSKGAYMISAVAEMYGIHPQTLRLYEREGLLKPSRTEGNTRLYSEEDLEQQPLADHRERFGDAPRARHRFLQRFVVGGEVVERAVLVAPRDVRVGEAVLPDACAPAVAADHSPHAILVDRRPSGVVATWTRHRCTPL